jgi:hypothetical protein
MSKSMTLILATLVVLLAASGTNAQVNGPDADTSSDTKRQ